MRFEFGAATDPKIQMTNPGSRPRSVARHSLAVLLASTALGVVSAHAIDGTWTGTASSEWTDGTNWTSNPTPPDGTGTFTNNGAPTTVDANGLVNIGAIGFTGAAPAYTININDFFLVNGTGVANSSAAAQTFNINSSLGFQNNSSASAGATPGTYFNSGAISFSNSSTAGTAAVTNNGVLEFNDTSTAASATVTNNGTTNFQDSSSAGSAHFTNNASGAIAFNTSSNAGTSVITNDGAVQFNNSSSGGSANLTNNVGGLWSFNDTSTAGAATVVNSGDMSFNNFARTGTSNLNNTGGLAFNDTGSADHATINNSGVINFNNTSTADHAHITSSLGSVSFLDQSNAANATILNNGPSSTFFTGNSSAGSANITNIDTVTFNAATLFFSAATAANSTITNDQGGRTVFGNANGTDTATAGSAHIINNIGGSTLFLAATTAGSATISNLNLLQFGSVGGTDTATAANSTIDNSGNLIFQAATTAGNAAITTNNGAFVFFRETSTGGNARFITNAGGTVDISALTTAGTTAGSIEGAGSYVLGARNLAVGSNNLSTTVSGVISGIGGSLTKVGTGTLILTGTNTYTGGTTISGGTLQIGTGGTTGSIVGNVLDNGILLFNRSNAYSFGGSISGNGSVRQIGAGTTTLTAANTYTGPTAVSAGTLAIAAGGSITSNVTNNATFNNAGTVTGSVNNNGTASNSGTITNGLTNAAGTATNSGTINGGATVTGGTLNTNTATSIVNGGLTNAATVNAAGAVNGAIFNNSGNFNVVGNLTGNSTFTNAATATLAVGAATYTLQGLLTNSGFVTVASGGQLIATAGGITNNAGGSITVAAGGTVQDVLNNAGTVTNNGIYLANVASNSGSITNNGVWTGNVLSNTGAITNNLTWTGTVSNAGTFTNNAGATVTGLLTNTAGITTNNGTLAGGAIISGGTLIGTGSVSNLTIASGGTFATGNGTPGTSMNVTGNLAFQSGALYLVQVNPATAAFTTVAGTATLGGATVNVAFAPGSYVDRQYTIVSATGGVSGTFNPNVTSNIANIQSTLSYGANNAFLNIKLSFVPPPGATLSFNQQNVANALTNFFNTGGSIPAGFAALNAAGLTVASGELGTGVIQSSIKADDLFLNLLLDPSVAGRAGGFVPAGGAASQFADDDEAPAYAAKRRASPSEHAAYAMATKAPKLLAAQPVNRWSVWGAGYGGSATTQGNVAVGSQDTAARVYGVVAGADYKVSPNTLLGFALAGGGTSFTLANALGHGSSDLFQAGAFGRHNFGPAYVSAALAYGWHDVTTNRTVALAGVDQLQGRFKAETFSARFEGGYRLATPLVGITPYAAAQVISFNLPRYAEQSLAGGGLFALNYASQTTTATRTELGLRSDKSIAVQDAVLTLRARAAWAHDYNPDRAVTAVFQALPGASFVVNGARSDPDAALVSAGAEMKWLNGFSLMATFEGEFSGNTTSYAGKGVARYTW